MVLGPTCPGDYQIIQMLYAIEEIYFEIFHTRKSRSPPASDFNNLMNEKYWKESKIILLHPGVTISPDLQCFWRDPVLTETT